MTGRPSDLVLGDPSVQRLEELGDQLGAGDRWATFIGAGVSKSANLPDWPDLVRAAGQRYDVKTTGINPDNYPLFFDERERASEDFWSFIESEICANVASSRFQELVMKLPFEVFLTFNYDCSLDGLHAQIPSVGLPPRAVYPEFLPTVDLRERRMIYLHGKCDCEADEGQRLSANEVVLTLTGYQSAYSETSLLPHVLESVFSSYRVLFLGVGFNEWRIKKILDLVQQREQKSSKSEFVANPRHMAITSSRLSPVEVTPTDMEFGGLSYGVAPIYYFNPEGGKHEALPPILEWLLDRARAQGVLGNVVGPA